VWAKLKEDRLDLGWEHKGRGNSNWNQA
jgi:hypothetical protein